MMSHRSPLLRMSFSLIYWTWTAASVVFLCGSSLALFPRLLLFLSADPRPTLSPLEAFLATHFGVFLAALSLTLVLNVPSPAPPILNATAPVPHHPLLIPITLASLTSAFLAWNTKSVGPLATVAFSASILVGLWGLWQIVFGNESLISNKTGADKHTSAFLFGNKSAASAQKKQWKKERDDAWSKTE